MKSALLLSNLATILLAALALWSIRHELTARATTYRAWAYTPALAIVVAAMLLIVSPGKRYELWVLAIIVGLALGALAGALLKINQDRGLRLIRVPPTWDGAGAAALLVLLALARLVTSNLMTRPSGKFGVLAASAAFLAAYLAARYVVAILIKAPKAVHLDMIEGRNPGRTLIP
jgi:hypothetical protein